MVKIFKALTAGIFLITSIATTASAISSGEEAPHFKVTSGDGKVLTSDMLKGRIAVVFYETKDTKEKNRALKDILNAFYAGKSSMEQNEIARLAVIRCSNFFPNIWRRQLRENSKKEGIVIYGDWDGSMEKDYGMVSDDSNFLIIDKKGIVRYVRAGAIPEKDFGSIKKIIDELK